MMEDHQSQFDEMEPTVIGRTEMDAFEEALQQGTDHVENMADQLKKKPTQRKDNETPSAI